MALIAGQAKNGNHYDGRSVLLLEDADDSHNSSAFAT